MSVQEHYEAVLRDLLDKRVPLRERADDLSRQQDALSKAIEHLNSLIAAMQQYVKPVELEPSEQSPLLKPYSAMSMRWACLKLLYGHKASALTTGAIAMELLSGGYPSSPNLSSKLSAILGQMVAKGELSRSGDAWQINDSGVLQWHSIRESERYLNRHAKDTEEIEPEGL